MSTTRKYTVESADSRDVVWGITSRMVPVTDLRMAVAS